MKYNELIQLYFERSNALQAYWTLYVVVLGGLLGFSSLRKQPALLTTVIVAVLFALFAYENLSAIQVATRQRFATLDAIKTTASGVPSGSEVQQTQQLLEPTLRPASPSAVTRTHVISDVLTLLALGAMELRRRRYFALESATNA
jgi:hypothetical protein